MNLTKEMIVFFTAMLPISELRGAIPLGINLGIEPINSFLLSVMGNLIIVPILLFVLHPIFTYFKTLRRFRDWINSYEERAAKKVKSYRKFRLLGLFLLVALPIPTTGVYTGVVAANVLKIKFKNAWIIISLGVVTAGVIVYMISMHVISLF